MKKTGLFIGISISLVFVFQAFTIPPAPKWQNLKILPQDISKEGLDSVMHHFTASLNVKCNYCHVRNNETRKMAFEKDDKPEKLIARKMMLMAIDINMNHFNQITEEDKDGVLEINNKDSVSYMLAKVTCFTCHRGAEHPENTPPKREPRPTPTPAQGNAAGQ